ncbi:lipocalin-like domain-containing protein [Mucilaginibacter sp. BJC16-A38]|uniref:lipocalin-like domain-containing protein n=1 Tax=Mucilaginibacter phenanthrenivorans TaxID=1234842 RepID=UPI002158899C|nr:lipocalin-like domain-containing protein [Mucilaginibacter phenanthrenivorans]MCR8561432.1 lipocalin-like domain-containing protein [Mucilaginibacter phenanthrenivorans]
MKNTLITIFFVLTTLAVYAQKSTKNLPGTYTLVSVDNIDKNGSRIHLYGDNPQGLLILDLQGNYSLQIMNSGRPKFAAADKAKGTDDENRAAVKGCNTHFGTYTVDEGKGIIKFNIVHASFPNWEGTQQVRPFTLLNGVFTYTVPSPTTGGTATGEVVWKRVE